jgi:hypothetical protein
LTGFLVFILPGTAGQCAVATVFSILTFIVFAKVSLFADTLDRYHYWLGCVVLFLSTILALLSKGDYISADTQSQEVLPVVLLVLNLLLIVSVVLRVVVFSRHAHKLTKSAFGNNDSSLDKAACNDDDVDVNDVIVKAAAGDDYCAVKSGTSSEHQQQQQQRKRKQSAQVGPRQFDAQSPTH